MSAEENPAEQLAGADAAQLAQLVAGASDEQLAEMMGGEGRKPVLDEIFRRMSEHVDETRAKEVDAVIDWKITEGPDGATDHYQVAFKHGKTTVTEDGTETARVTFVVPGVNFIKLVSGAVQGPSMFMSGGLKIEGDLMFAAQVEGLFQIPKAA